MMVHWLDRVKRIFAPKSLRLQLLSRSLVILSALLILIGIFQYVIMSHFLYQSTATNIRNEIRNAAPQAWEQLLGGAQTSQGIPDDQSGSPGGRPFFSFNISSIAFINTNNQFTTIQGTAPHLTNSEYALSMATPHETSGYEIARDSNGNKQLLVLQPVSDDGLVGLVQIGTSVKSLQHILMEQLEIFLVLALLALVAGLFAFLPILRRTLVPLSRMVSTVRRINAGNLDERFETKQSQLEIELLSSSFNDMLDRLHQAFTAERDAKERMRQFVADASHELRTPLTSIHGFLEVLLRGAADKPEQLHKALRSMYSESERVRKLVQDLLLLAQLDREPKLTLRPGNLVDVVHDMEPQLSLLAGERGVDFDLTQSAHVNFDKDGIKQVILNLFQNAVQHTDEITGAITVTVQQRGDLVELRIQDNGPGLTPSQLNKVFERFYRVDTARSRSHGGAGLGLAITKSIVDGHGGHIACVSELGHGATFVVTLPSA